MYWFSLIFARQVALRKESVDRNIELLLWGGWGARSLSARRAWIEILTLTVRNVPIESLSARRAWIEMLKIGLMLALSLVALRKESVDRNCEKLQLLLMTLRRSPQGERG